MANSAEDKAAEKAAKEAGKVAAATAKAEAAAAEKAAKEAAAAASPKVDSDRKARWAAFLDAAEEQRRKDGTSHVFEAQRARGEFDTIPDTFI